MIENNNGFILWFTGLSAAGKTTIADQVYKKLKEKYERIERLDGDIVRKHLSNLGFSKEDRNANIERVGFVVKLLARNGVIVVASFISPYRKQREELKQRIPGFVEIYVATPLAVCEDRDPKGMYKKARKGEIKNFTGIDDPYEEPLNPEIKLETHKESVDDSVKKVFDYLESKDLLDKKIIA